MVEEQRTDAPVPGASLGSSGSSRRKFLLAGAVAGLGAAAGARAEELPVPASSLKMGAPIPPESYGMPIEFEAHVKRRRSDVFKNKQNYSDWSMTPLHQQIGIVTPNGLFFERHHNGVAKIDPEQHRLVIHGLVEKPI